MARFWADLGGEISLGSQGCNIEFGEFLFAASLIAGLMLRGAAGNVGHLGACEDRNYVVPKKKACCIWLARTGTSDHYICEY